MYFDRILELDTIVNQIDIIGITYQNSSIKVISKFNIKVPIPREIRNPLFSKTIAELIRQNKVVVACNVLVKNRVTRAYWIIMAPNKIKLIEYKLYSKQWRYNTARVAEAIVLLDLIITIIKKHIKSVQEGL